MNGTRGRAATIVAGACLAVVLIVVPSAQAAVTASHITSPKDPTYLIYQDNSPNTFPVAGTSTGTSGDHVDLACYYGTSSYTLAHNVAVNANGSFSAPAVSLANPPFSPCWLRAIPSGTAPAKLKPFAGVRVLIGDNRLYTVDTGPNAGALYDYYSFFQQLGGGFDYYSLGSCGVCDGYLSEPSFAQQTVTFWSNAALYARPTGAANRSEVQVDGANAYPTLAAEQINSKATGLPKLKYSYSQNKKTGNVVIHETDPLVKCTDPTYPPTTVSCATFVPTGVTVVTTMTQDQSGRLAWVSDVFKSTDGKSHALDLQWDNSQRFYGSSGNASLDAYEFPGHHSYSTHVAGDSVSLPSGPGTIFVRVQGVPDGNVLTGRGAIVYDRTATKARFRYATSDSESFTLDQTGKVPAGGSTTFRFAYAQGYTQASVNSLAHLASGVFKGCTVPKVTGKPLATAKKAIRRANCTVGKITHASSTTVAAGDVITSKPKAKTHLDYHAKVSLVVSNG